FRRVLFRSWLGARPGGDGARPRHREAPRARPRRRARYPERTLEGHRGALYPATRRQVSRLARDGFRGHLSRTSTRVPRLRWRTSMSRVMNSEVATTT